MATRRADDASTEGMRAGGYYDAHSEYQRVVIEGGDEIIRVDRRGTRPRDSARARTIVDYGAGTGATSVHAMSVAIGALRERATDLPILAVHNDVATNDFTQLFRNVSGDDGYLATPGAPIYPAAAAGSFFTQVLPSGSVDLGMCSNARPLAARAAARANPRRDVLLARPRRPSRARRAGRRRLARLPRGPRRRAGAWRPPDRPGNRRQPGRRARLRRPPPARDVAGRREPRRRRPPRPRGARRVRLPGLLPKRRRDDRAARQGGPSRAG